MLYQKERELIVNYGRKILESNLTKGTGGNISIFIREKKLMAITPSGLDYLETKPEDILIMDLNKNIIDGTRTPSSEYWIHCIFYQQREDINSIVHVHPTYSTTLSCLNWDLPAVHYLVAVSGGNNVSCAKYGTFGTDDLAKNVFLSMKDRYAVLLANHGLLTGGKDLPNAYDKALEIEFCAEIYCRAKALGEPIILSDFEMENLVELFKSYGQVKIRNK